MTKIQDLQMEVLRKNLRFVEARVTNTRLMGVVGLICNFKDKKNRKITHIYHLDFEEYGIDGYDEYINLSDDEINNKLIRVIGGLGGNLVPISFKEFIFLLKSAYEVNLEYKNLNKEFILNSILLSENEELSLMEKVCESIIIPTQLINYFIMRFVAGDKKGLEFLSAGRNLNYHIKEFKNPSTLIKNEIKLIDSFETYEIYEVESLIDYNNKYMILISNIEVRDNGNNMFIEKFELLNNITISAKEAFLNLNKKEYIAIYSIKSEGFRSSFYFKKPELMLNIHKNGSLYTEFKINNDHVKLSKYYLNGDIFAVYYVTDSDQLVVSTFEEENLFKVNDFFQKNGFENYLEYEGDYEIDSSIIYEFVNSEFENFYDFINMT